MFNVINQFYLEMWRVKPAFGLQGDDHEDGDLISGFDFFEPL